MTEYFNVCAMHETVCEDLIIVRVHRASHSEIRDGWIRGKSSDQLRWPIGADNGSVIVDLREGHS